MRFFKTCIFLFVVFSAKSQTSKDSAAIINKSEQKIGDSLIAIARGIKIQLADFLVKENRLQTVLGEQSRNIEVISRAQIENAPVQSVAELLSYVAGVDIRQRGVHGVQADVSIQGGTFDQTLLLIDGVKLSDPQTGHHSLNLPIDKDQIERIEILKGAGARVFGQNAFAGAINIVTRRTQERFVSVGVEVGDFGLYGVRLSAAAGGHLLSLSTEVSNGYRPNSDYKLQNAFYQGAFPIGDQKLHLTGGITTRNFGASGFYSPTNVSAEHEAIQTNFAAADMTFNHNNDWSVTPRLSWRRNQDDYSYNYSDATTRNFSLSQVLSAELNGSFKNAWGKTGAGADFTQTYYYNAKQGNHYRSLTEIFLEHRFNVWDWGFDLTPGIMLAAYSDFGTHLFPGIDAGLKLTKNTKLYASYGRTFRIPTYTDLYFSNGANNNNPNLQPEYADVYEAGVKYDYAAGWLFSADYFDRNSFNIIDRTKEVATDKWTPTNINHLDVRGIEGAVTFNMHSRFNDPFVKNIQIGYTKIFDPDFTKQAAFSKYALDFLSDQLTAGVDTKIYGAVGQHLQFRFVNRITLPSYAVFDWRIYYQTKAMNIYAQASNLLNAAYTEQNNIPAPPRWFSIGVSYKLSD